MNPAQIIQNLIENCAADDNEKLFQINALVWRYCTLGFASGAMKLANPRVKPYSTSIDAQAAILPKGWHFDIKQYPTGRSQVTLYNVAGTACTGMFTHQSEPLARLWAIISAIEWERRNGA